MRYKALIVALATSVVTACAGAGAGPEAPGAAGDEPRDNEATRAASVALVQAGLAEGEDAEAQYEEAMTNALDAIEQMPDNAKGYLIAGQAAVGLEDYVRADTMFEQAQELYPPYEDQIVVEREQGWADAYNLGAAALNEGDLDTALQYFQGANRLYQGRPEARVALGSVHVQQGDFEAAAEAYTSALEILNAPPPEGMEEEQLAEWDQQRQEVSFHAADLLAQTGDFAQAADILQEFLAEHEEQLDSETQLRARTALAGFLAQAGRAEEAEEIYTDLLSREDLTAHEYFQAGIGFFNTGDFERAADAFGTAAEMNPYNRDALLNLVQALYSQAVEMEELEETPERNEELRTIYERIIDMAEEVRELDPLNRNVLSFMLRAYRAKADLSDQAEAQQLTRAMQELIREFENQQYDISDIQLNIEQEGQAQIEGAFTNLTGTPGETVQLRFSALDSAGNVVDTTTMDVTVPDANSATQLTGTLNIGSDFAGWRYELVQ
ncbi:MAG: tetratricopeptide repeat protein [Gemmatimonadota bacterium]